MLHTVSNHQAPFVAMSGPSYPHRFLAASAYAGFGLQTSSSTLASRFSDDATAILYALHQQATVGPCKTAEPSIRSALEYEKWKSWKALANMPSIEAMRLFVKILEEEDPAWLTKVQDPETEMKGPVYLQAESQSEGAYTLENGTVDESESKDASVEGIDAVAAHNIWISLKVSGRKPTPRYQHASVIVGDKMYVVGGNHNGRYLNDVQLLDLQSLTWSKLDQSSIAPDSMQFLPPCAGHSLVRWGNTLLVVAGRSKERSDTVVVRAFDMETKSWSVLKLHGKGPIARGGQSVTLVGSKLIMFGGEDSKRRLLNDMNILHLETMTWEAVETIGIPPTPRCDHVATVQGGRYLLVFGGGSHSTCFNDLHVLDLDNMEWSRPQPQGVLPTPRAGHAGVTIGDSWYIIGGGDNKNGISETLVLNTSTFVWSVAVSVEGRTPIASEGLSVVSTSGNSEEILLAFGGYNGHYSNEVYVMKTSQKIKSQPKYLESPAAAAAAAAVKAAYAVPQIHLNGTRSQDSPYENKVKEILMDVPNNMMNRDQSSAVSKTRSDLEMALSALQAENLHLKQELDEVQSSNSELAVELHTLRGQLGDEQSRCFQLEVDLAEVRQKLHSMDSLYEELELLRGQIAAADEAAAAATVQLQQSSGGVWGWLAGTAPSVKSSQM